MSSGGILIVNKQSGVTSHDIVNKVRRLFGTKQVGHAGTLDPIANGVLVVLCGRAAKASEFAMADKKCYRAEMKLGITTDTEDVTGNILTESKELPSSEMVEEVTKSFIGDIKQIPPMYSAIKTGGKKLYELARQGVTVEREARDITVYSIDVDKKTDDLYQLDIVCSKGTYIRTLCADIGAALGCGGAMASLTRLYSGDFTIEKSVTVEELENMSLEEREARLLPVEALFYECDKLVLPEFFERLAQNGCEIYLDKVRVSYPEGTKLRLYGKDGFFALAEVMSYGDKLAAKPIKKFEL